MNLKKATYSLIAIFLFLAIFFTSCNQGGKSSPQNSNTTVPSKSVNWKYEPTIKEPLVAASDKQETRIGNLATNQLQVIIPGGAFKSSTQITLQNPKSVPDTISNQFTPLGAPVEILSAGATRLYQPATITLRISDKDKQAASLKAGKIWIAYYNGKKWEYFPPASSDAVSGTITFKTYHFSLWGYGTVNVEEQIKQYTHSASLAALAQGKADKMVENLVANVVDMILLDNLGWKDSSTKYKIVSSLANDDEYRKLVDLFVNKDIEKFNRTLQIFAGKQIIEHVDKASFLSYLKGVTKNVGAIDAASTAAGYIAEGQYTEAARILGENFSNSLMITKLANAGAEVIQYNIDLWKDSEIEAAFQAFKNGADNKFWGYNVDKGDFEGLWNQMRGISTRLEIEAAEREIKRRASLGIPPATESELNSIRAQVKKEMEDNFKQRLSQESELEKEAIRLQSLVNVFQSSRLLEFGMYGYSEANDTVELRLDKLFHMVKKILRDTGRQNWNLTAFTNDKEVCANDMVSLIKAWYSTDGEKEYAKVLKEKFGIDLNVKKYILESAKPVVKKVTADTKDYFGNSFKIITGSAVMGPGSGQFSSGIAWGGTPTKYTGFMGSIGFWSGPPAGINPGDQVTIKLQLIPSYDSKTTASFAESMTIIFNKQSVGEVSWNNSSKLTQVDKTVTINIPDAFKEPAFDIEIFSSVPSGSGSEIYHYVLNPEYGGK